MIVWETWAKGLLAAFIGGASNGITVVIVSPAEFNLQTGWQKLVSVCLVSGIVSAALYLKQSPIPQDK